MAVIHIPLHRRVSRCVRACVALAALLALVAMTSLHAATERSAGAQGWLEQMVIDSEGAGYDKFGMTVALSGTTAFVAGSEIAVDGNSGQGKVLVYDQAVDGSWSLTQTLVASDGAAFSEFGWSIALHGDTAVIGAINARIGSNNSQGAAYVFTRGGDGRWSETQKLFASDGIAVDWFGNAVAVSDDTIVVAAYGAHYNDQAMRGALYVFTPVDGVWTQTQQLAASDGTVGNQLGYAIALDGSSLLASAPGAGIGDNYAIGAVYAYSRTDGVWSETQKILADDGQQSDQLGTALALDGDTALIGAMWYHGGTGATYVFNRSGGAWHQAQRLGTADGAPHGLAGIGLPETDNFGMSVALQGDTALIGASNVTIDGAQGQGAAYQFTRSGAAFVAAHTFTATAGILPPFFGNAIAFDGGNVVAGAFGYTPDWDHYQQGAVYFYTRTASGIPASERAALIDLYNGTNGAGWWDMVGWLGEPGTECSWTGVTCDESGTTVVGLFFGFTNMAGSLPATLNQLTNLTSVVIGDQNQLTGAFPSLAGLTQLQSIDIRNTALSGRLPSLAGLTSLQAATFLNNQFDGSIPPFGELPALTWFSASANRLSGDIPSLDGLPVLSGFYVGGNLLSGAPPVPPASLSPAGSELCPNALDHVESSAWDVITGVTPWYRDCTATTPETIFGDGFDGS